MRSDRLCERRSEPLALADSQGFSIVSGADWRLQRAAAAFFAISLRFSGVKLAARIFPPFSPPFRPSSAAAALNGSGSGSGSGGAVPVSRATESKARALKSRGRLGLLDQFCMPQGNTGRPRMGPPCASYR